MIPKILHFVWSGPHRLPDYAKPNIDAWRKSHPGYGVRLWTDDNRPALDGELLRAYNNARNAGESSDVVRHSLLREFGGWSIDLDIQPVVGKVNALDALYVEMGRWYDEMGVYADGLVLDDGSRVVGSAAGGAMISEVCRQLPATIQRGILHHGDLRAALTGFGLIRRCLETPKAATYTAIAPGSYFPVRQKSGTSAIGIHEWAGEWLHQLDSSGKG